MAKKTTYKDSGVDKQAGYDAVSLIKPLAKATYDKNVLEGVGSFGALYQMPQGYTEPVLVSGADGVGTKLLVAQARGQNSTIGIDLVAMCANDVLAMNAKPLFFLDYFSTGKLDPKTAEAVVSGIAEGCKIAQMSLVGGETAEMPQMYGEGSYDLAGFCVGVAEKRDLCDPKNVLEGDCLIGFASNGVHSNGFSLIRSIFFDDGWDALNRALPWGGDLGDELLKPTRIYSDIVGAIRGIGIAPKAMCHITGGGFYENVPRMMPEGLKAKISIGSFPSQPIFDYISKEGNIDRKEMFSTFNMGIGFIAAIDPKDKERCLELEGAYLIGEAQKGEGIDL